MTEAKTHKVTLIPGDDIGPEATQAALRIFEATGVRGDLIALKSGGPTGIQPKSRSSSCTLDS
jgi:isocitrate/isopropylmalate dehydrogenase